MTKILIVEDNKVNAELTRIVLENNGFIPLLAEDSVQALEILGEHNDVPLAMIDLHLPGMNGTDLAKMLRETHKPMKLIAFTASAMNSDLAETVAHFDGCITKPISIRTISDTLRKFLE